MIFSFVLSPVFYFYANRGYLNLLISPIMYKQRMNSEHIAMNTRNNYVQPQVHNHTSQTRIIKFQFLSVFLEVPVLLARSCMPWTIGNWPTVLCSCLPNNRNGKGERKKRVLPISSIDSTFIYSMYSFPLTPLTSSGNHIVVDEYFDLLIPHHSPSLGHPLRSTNRPTLRYVANVVAAFLLYYT